MVARWPEALVLAGVVVLAAEATAEVPWGLAVVLAVAAVVAGGVTIADRPERRA